MAKTLVETLTKTAEGRKLFQQERVTLEITELICQIMNREGLSRTGLAKRLDKPVDYIVQLLGGRADVTISEVSDVFTVLGKDIHFYETPSP